MLRIIEEHFQAGTFSRPEELQKAAAQFLDSIMQKGVVVAQCRWRYNPKSRGLVGEGAKSAKKATNVL